MSKKEKYCGIGPVPRNKTRGSMLECVEKGEVRYWGLRSADKKTLQKANLNKLKTSVIKLKNDILDMKDKYKKMTNKSKKAELMKQMSAKNELFNKKQRELIEFKKKEPEPEPEPDPKPEPKTKTKTRKTKESESVVKPKKDEENDNELEDMHYYLDKLITSLNKIKKEYPNPLNKKHEEIGGNNNIYLNINTCDTKQPAQYSQYPIQSQQTTQPIQPIQPQPQPEPQSQPEPQQKKPPEKKKWAKVETNKPIKKIAPQKIDARTQNLKDKMTEELKKIKPKKVDDDFKSNLAALLRPR
jgi:hypothetical protein